MPKTKLHRKFLFLINIEIIRKHRTFFIISFALSFVLSFVSSCAHFHEIILANHHWNRLECLRPSQLLQNTTRDRINCVLQRRFDEAHRKTEQYADIRSAIKLLPLKHSTTKENEERIYLMNSNHNVSRFTSKPSYTSAKVMERRIFWTIKFIWMRNAQIVSNFWSLFTANNAVLCRLVNRAEIQEMWFQDEESKGEEKKPQETYLLQLCLFFLFLLLFV